MIREFLGQDALRPGDIGLPTVNGYAYYRYSRAGMARLTLGTPRQPRLLTASGSRSVQTRWREEEHPRYRGVVERWGGKPVEGSARRRCWPGPSSC